MWLCRGRGEMTKEHVLFCHFLCEKWGALDVSESLCLHTGGHGMPFGEYRRGPYLRAVATAFVGAKRVAANDGERHIRRGSCRGWLVRPQTTS